MQQELALATKYAGDAAKAAAMEVRKAEAALRREERLEEERMKRWAP